MQKPVAVLIALLFTSCAFISKRSPTLDPAGIHRPPMAISNQNLVVTCQSQSAKIGMDVLRAGGNAADAFIAATVAEYVVAPGYTSLSGPLYVLYFDARTGKTSYLNAGLNTVADPAGQWSEKKTLPGTAYIIGGAGRGLEALHKRFGSPHLTFKDLIVPSVHLAKTGFVLDRSFAGAIRARLPILRDSPSWLSQFTKNGLPLRVGDTLAQPELAETLNQFGDNGADYLFKGKYARDLVKLIRSQGGKLTLNDLTNYQVQWSDPLETQYRGLIIQTSSYRSYGGLELLLELKAVENLDLSKHPHFSKDRETFEKVLRTLLFSKREIFRYMTFANREDDPTKLRQIIEGPLPQKVWAEVTDLTKSFPRVKDDGNHSCSPVIVDKDGNIAAGTHTIGAAQWGDFGLRVGGVSLNTAHSVALDAPPGVRAIDGLKPVLVFKDGKPFIAASFFSRGLHVAAFQTLLNLIDYQMTPQQAIESPRFGPPTYKPVQMEVDKRLPSEWIAEFAKQGIMLSQPNGFVDTGMAMVIRIDPSTHVRSGSPTDLLPNAAVIGE